jgi:histone H3/H4
MDAVCAITTRVRLSVHSLSRKNFRQTQVGRINCWLLLQVAQFNEMLRTAGKDCLQAIEVQQSALEEMEDKYKAALENLKEKLEVGLFVMYRVFRE